MDAILETFNRAVEQLLGRASGPLHFRLVIQPILSILLAVRAGLKDAAQGNPPFLWTVLSKPAERKRLIKSGRKDIGKVFIVAVVLDTIYQVVVLHAFYPVQTLIVATVLALLPYSLLRGPVTRIARGVRRPRPGEAKV
jgi:hypothetical protein